MAGGKQHRHLLLSEDTRKDEMRNGKIAGWALTAFMATATVQLMAQQNEGPILLPKKPAAKPAAATLLVMCDLACNWKLDGEPKGHINAGGAARARVEFGQHVVVAATDDGADQAHSRNRRT